MALARERVAAAAVTTARPQLQSVAMMRSSSDLALHFPKVGTPRALETFKLLSAFPIDSDLYPACSVLPKLISSMFGFLCVSLFKPVYQCKPLCESIDYRAFFNCLRF